MTRCVADRPAVAAAELAAPAARRGCRWCRRLRHRLTPSPCVGRPKMPSGLKTISMIRIDEDHRLRPVRAEAVGAALVERLDDADQHAAEHGAGRLPMPPSTAAVKAIRPSWEPVS